MRVLNRKETTCYIKNKYKKPKAIEKWYLFPNGVFMPKLKAESENLKKFIQEWLVVGSVNVPYVEANTDADSNFSKYKEHVGNGLKSMAKTTLNEFGYYLKECEKKVQTEAHNIPLVQASVDTDTDAKFSEWEEYLKNSLKSMFNIDPHDMGFSLNDGKKIVQTK